MKKTNPLVDLTEFFQQRKSVEETFNNEIVALKTRLKAEATPTILFSLQMQDTTVNLGKEIREVFHYQYHEYPEDGLVLQVVEVTYAPTVGDDFSFRGYLDLVFKMSDENWNGRVSLSKTSFDDEKKVIIENSMGICYNPRFNSREKYFEVKGFIESALRQIKEYF